MNLRRPISFAATFALALFLAACGGDGPTDPGGAIGPGTGGATRTVKADPSFANDVMEILTRRGCTSGGCHGAGAGGLTMTSAATAYGNLVGVASTGTGEIRVIAGNANDSYLVKKLEGRAAVGAQMPLGGGSLDTTDLTNIKNWINRGAKNN